ncbi:hypothetical protein [Alteraurantiacibacter aestuarii]|uniref:Lipoprotein n=1 Tax=Alteraurantiacibacter aestuarii TaxID=650004 RepID=A0A844ZNC3_9SPHN|nr:hypothetical protein [Alteraurantiacibacter aestuarii]MXO88566.1 hypothetical protein [Alteraurantiacibacter aestuarii]
MIHRHFIAPVLVAAMLAGCTDGCENVVLERARAPFGNADAVAFERNCGATTGYSTQVSIVDRDDAPTDAGNILIASGRSFAEDSNRPTVSLEWLGSEQLSVRYDASLAILSHHDRYGRTIISLTPMSGN